ncbi:MAG: ParA family protein [Anaerolineae bacterium]|jgi:chromosome partitioning protein
MSITVAISNQKGGVAKTTTCLSLGAALAEMGRTVLVIDLDPQANLSLSLGLQPQQLRRTIVDTLMGTHTLVSISQETEVLGLDVVPANYELALVDKVFYKLPNYQFRLRQALQRIDSEMYDYVFLDCPPTLSPLTLNALTAAQLLILPVQCEPYAVQSLHKMLRLTLQMREQVNPDLIYRVLVTMYDQRNKISRLLLDQIQDRLAKILFKTIIQIDTKLRECTTYGQPITRYASKTRSAEQYRALARELQDPEIDSLLRKQSRSSETNHV